MKKSVTWVLASALAVTLLAGCGAANDTGAAENADTVETETGAEADAGAEAENIGNTSDRTTLTVGFDAEFEPYGYMDENGEYTGFDLDLAAEVCARNSWELIKQPIDWDAKDMELSSGSIDCIWNGFTINGREDNYTWSIPYVDSSQVFVAKSDAGLVTPADLADKSVGVQKDSSALAALEDEAELSASFRELVQYADYNMAFLDLEAGAIDAIAIDIGVAEKQIASRGAGFNMMEEKLATEQYGIGFLKGNVELKDQVENTLQEMVADGTFMEIAKKYGLEDSVCLGK